MIYRVFASILAVIVAGGCSVPSNSNGSNDTASPLDLSRFELVDLTHAYNEKTLYWPTSPTAFRIERLSYGRTEGGYFYSANSISTPEHGGTHLDAPVHFGEGKQTADQVPLEQLMAPAIVLDVTQQASTDREYRLTREDVVAWEEKHGRIPERVIVLLRTGWSRFWPDAFAYLGDSTKGDASKLRFPSYGEDAARLLVEERRVAALGVDTASIDFGQSRDFKVHQIAASANVPGMENLTSLDRLPASGATVIALPMKIVGGSGGPLRAVALIPRGRQ